MGGCFITSNKFFKKRYIFSFLFLPFILFLIFAQSNIGEFGLNNYFTKVSLFQTSSTENVTEETTNETITETSNVTLPENITNITSPIENITEENVTVIENITEFNETNVSTQEPEEILEIEKRIQKELKKEIKENPKKKLPVIIQLKTKEKTELVKKIELKEGEIEESLDERLIMAEITAEDLEYIAEDSNIEKIWPDRKTIAFLDFSVEQINAPFLWNLGFNGSGVKIAILDTGINSNHEMLYGKVISQEDFTGSNDANDYNGHGTHVAGIATGTTDYGGNYNGVAPSGLLLNGKVLDNNGYGMLSWLINGIDWAMDPDNNPDTDDGADIISLSLGATYDSEPEDLLNSPEVLKIKEAVDKGITVVIASGNCGSGCGSFNGVTTPGISPDAITIGAINDNNEWADFSSGDYILNYIKPDLVAPGVNICSALGNDYGCLSGTSMSTPHVSGAAALLLQKDPSLSPAQIKAMLENSALDLGEAGKDIKFGSGLIDLSKIGEAPEPEIPEDKDYDLKIPAFEIGKENEIILLYKNKLEKGKKESDWKIKTITVKFEVEELDKIFTEEHTEKISPKKVGEFKFSWTPNLMGKHLLKIDIYEKDELLEHIETAVGVYGNFEDRLANVNILVK